MFTDNQINVQIKKMIHIENKINESIANINHLSSRVDKLSNQNYDNLSDVDINEKLDLEIKINELNKKMKNMEHDYERKQKEIIESLRKYKIKKYLNSNNGHEENSTNDFEKIKTKIITIENVLKIQIPKEIKEKRNHLKKLIDKASYGISSTTAVNHNLSEDEQIEKTKYMYELYILAKEKIKQSHPLVYNDINSKLYNRLSIIVFQTITEYLENQLKEEKNKLFNKS